MKDKFKIHQVFCSNHPSKQGSFYCLQDKEIVCSECAFSKHSNHQNQTRELSQEDLNSYYNKAEEKIKELRDKLS